MNCFPNPHANNIPLNLFAADSDIDNKTLIYSRLNYFDRHCSCPQIKRTADSFFIVKIVNELCAQDNIEKRKARHLCYFTVIK